jgi:hypothetical protein
MTTAALVIQGIIGVFLPILVKVVTQWTTTSYIKGAILAALSLLSGVIVEWRADTHLNLGLALLFAFEAWGLGVVTHFGLWKPAGATANRAPR